MGRCAVASAPVAADVRIARDDDEIGAAARVVGTAFLDRPDDEVVAWRRSWVTPERVLVAEEDGTICGTALSFNTDLTLPGGAGASTCAVSAVGVLPTHRRRGHLTSLMELQLGHAIEAGEILAALIAAEWPIYGRYGYGMGIPAATYEVDTRLARFLDEPFAGSVELVDLATLRKLAPDVFEQHHRATPGAIARTDAWWDANLGVNPRPGSKPGGNRFQAIRRDRNGVVDGYVNYETKGNWDRSTPQGRVEVHDLITITPEAYADLWRYLAAIDWTALVKMYARSVDEPLPYLLVDGRACLETHRGDHIWLRPLDVAAVLEARAYRTTDRVVLDVVDDTLARGGRFSLDVSPQGASCTRTPDEPDLTMSIATLGAACLGGTPLTLLDAAGLVDEHTAGAVTRVDAIFSWSPAPWCSTGF